MGNSNELALGAARNVIAFLSAEAVEAYIYSLENPSVCAWTTCQSSELEVGIGFVFFDTGLNEMFRYCRAHSFRVGQGVGYNLLETGQALKMLRSRKATLDELQQKQEQEQARQAEEAEAIARRQEVEQSLIAQAEQFLGNNSSLFSSSDLTQYARFLEDWPESDDEALCFNCENKGPIVILIPSKEDESSYKLNMACRECAGLLARLPVNGHRPFQTLEPYWAFRAAMKNRHDAIVEDIKRHQRLKEHLIGFYERLQAPIDDTSAEKVILEMSPEVRAEFQARADRQIQKV